MTAELAWVLSKGLSMSDIPEVGSSNPLSPNIKWLGE